MGSKLDGAPLQSGVDDGNDEHYPDILAQFPILNAYTQLEFGFELPSDADRDAIVSALQTSLDRLVEAIPWLGWQIGEKSGVRTAVPWPEDVSRQLLRVKNCDDIISPMSELLSAGVPISKLDGSVLAPWPALPMPHGITGPVPVVTLQANFVRGGLILNLSAHHTMMDAGADFQFLRLLATLLRGEELPAADLEQANRDRSSLIELIPRSEPMKDYSHLRRPPGYQFQFPTSPPQWQYFKIAESTLSKLADTAREPSKYVSDADALLAFYWQRICAIRLARGMPGDTVSKISRAIDGRIALDIPSTYMGSEIHMAITRLPLEQVTSLSLAELAQALRRELKQSNTAWAVRSLATFIAREPDRSALLYNSTHNGNTDVGATSSLNTAHSVPASWGPLLGACHFHRRPAGPPIPGSLVVQTAERGAIPILVCLPQVDLEALKKDAQWTQYTECIG